MHRHRQLETGQYTVTALSSPFVAMNNSMRSTYSPLSESQLDAQSAQTWRLLGLPLPIHVARDVTWLPASGWVNLAIPLLKPGTDVTRPHPVSSKLWNWGMLTIMCSWLVNVHSALVMDVAVPGPSKVLALLSSLEIAQFALYTYAIAIWNSFTFLYSIF